MQIPGDAHTPTIADLNLAPLARGGEVAVSTRREGYVEVKSLGPVPVKGLADPVDVYEVTRAGPARAVAPPRAIARSCAQRSRAACS